MLWITALPILALAVYAHYRLPQYTDNKATLWPTRIFLVLLGLGLGWVAAFRYFPEVEGAQQLALFFHGFGIAHFPSACVLFLKNWRRKTT